MHLIRKGQIGHIPSRTTSHIHHPRLKGKRLLKVRGQAADSGLVPMRTCGCVLRIVVNGLRVHEWRVCRVSCLTYLPESLPVI